jgi:hypothetical protein
VRLSKPTRDWDTELRLSSDVTEAEASAKVLAAAYCKRWTIETAFARMERLLNCEVASLGHPNAALLAFGVGLCAYALLSVIQAMLAAAHDVAKARRLSWHKSLLVAAITTKLVHWIEETSVRAWQRASLEEDRWLPDPSRPATLTARSTASALQSIGRVRSFRSRNQFRTLGTDEPARGHVLKHPRYILVAGLVFTDAEPRISILDVRA